MFLLTLRDLFYHFLCQVSRVASVTDVSASPALDQYYVLSPSSSVPHCMFKACVFSLDFHRRRRSGVRHRSRGHLRRVSRVAMSHLHGESPLTSSGYSLHFTWVLHLMFLCSTSWCCSCSSAESWLQLRFVSSTAARYSQQPLITELLIARRQLPPVLVKKTSIK